MDKNKLNELFRQFRKVGFIARQNFKCCSGCASVWLQDIIEKKLFKAAKKSGQALDSAKSRIFGAVFYHKQDTDSMYKSGVLHLRYGDVNTAFGEIGMNSKDVGDVIAGILKNCGYSFEWDGNPEMTIKVFVND